MGFKSEVAGRVRWVSASVGGMCRLGGMCNASMDRMRRWASEERVGGEGGRESDMFGPGGGAGCGAVRWCWLGDVGMG